MNSTKIIARPKSANEKSARRLPRRRRALVPPGQRTQKPDRHDRRQSQHLGGGQHVLRPFSFAHAEDVDGASARRSSRRHTAPARTAARVAFRPRPNLVGILGEDVGHRADRAGPNDPELAPGEEEARRRGRTRGSDRRSRRPPADRPWPVRRSRAPRSATAARPSSHRPISHAALGASAATFGLLR